MPIKISSWNCSLGLLNKVDLVREILKNYSIDVLYIQEAEIKPTTPLKLLEIEGYNLELSPTYAQNNSRTCCYIKTKIKYQRLTEKEDKGVEMIIINIMDYTISGFYSPFLLPNHTNRTNYFENVANILNGIENPNMIIIGDFNIDFSKICNQAYANTKLFEILEPILIEKTLTQIIKSPTWKRKSSTSLKESILDHIYVNNLGLIEEHIKKQQIVGDHNLIGITLKLGNINYPKDFPRVVDDWFKYSKEAVYFG